MALQSQGVHMKTGQKDLQAGMDRQRHFRGTIGMYHAGAGDSALGAVVVLADAENADLARDMGFVVAQKDEPTGLQRVYCPGERMPCWDIARQLGGRTAMVGMDRDGYSMFKLVRR